MDDEDDNILLFMLRCAVQLLGVLVLAIGIYSVSQSNFTSNMSALGSILFDPINLFFIVGSIVFVIGLFGCIGALRENIWILLVVCGILGVVHYRCSLTIII